MKFTIVFPSHESSDFSIGAVFIPCLVWMEGRKQILNPHRENSHYVEGDLQNLFSKTDVRKRIEKHTNRVTVVAHSTGHGTDEYLSLLRKDLEKEDFEVEVVYQ